MKKILLSLTTGFALFSTPLMAAPLQRAQVSADSKWLLHLDVEALQKSKTGAGLLALAVAEVGDDLKDGLKIDLPTLIAQTGSITAWGADFKPGPKGRGVLVWRGSKEVEQIATGLLVQQAEAAKAGQGIVKVEREGPDPIYSVGGSLFVTVLSERGILLSPKLDEIDTARRVMDGQAPSLADQPVFTEYAALPGGFFFLALAEGFARDAGLPAQAQVLKLAEGGRVALGEEADLLRLLVNLKAQTVEGAVQMQQVLQGVLALASLAQVDEPEFARMKDWARGAQVKSEEKMVSFNLSVPVEAALKQLNVKTTYKNAPQAEPEIQKEPKAEPVR